MEELKIELTKTPKELPDWDALGFGRIFMDHMFEMDYEEGKGWHNPRIVPHHDFNLNPANATLHYGQAIFEGLKAYRTADNRITMFRPMENMKRLNNSARILCVPEFDGEFVHECMKKLVEIDKRWVPAKKGTSLYIRPYIFSTDPYLGVSVGKQYKMAIILSPVAAYYAAGFAPVRIKVEDKYVRAVVGGTGEAKTAANYAASLHGDYVAHQEGFAQTLWLDGVERKYVEEVGSMNIFFKINGELITPMLTGSILPGITRKSVLELARSWGMKATERRITIEEVFEAAKNGQLEEAFGTGTAAVISPVGELCWKGQHLIINEGKTGETAQKLYDGITGIQCAAVEDPFGWVEEVTNG